MNKKLHSSGALSEPGGEEEQAQEELPGDSLDELKKNRELLVRLYELCDLVMRKEGENKVNK